MVIVSSGSGEGKVGENAEGLEGIDLNLDWLHLNLDWLRVVGCCVCGGCGVLDDGL